MVKVDEMGDWRRTHVSTDLGPDLDGKDAIVMGWISSIRKQGKIMFILLHDIKGAIQVTAITGKTPEKILAKLQTLSLHSVIAIKGKVKSISKAPQGAEIIPEDIRILNTSTEIPPFRDTSLSITEPVEA